MTCQHCHANDAELTIRFQYKDYEWEVRLCEECAAAIQQATGAALMELQKRMVPAGSRRGEGTAEAAETAQGPGAPTALSQRVTRPFPGDVGDEIRRRRRKNELSALLREAVAAEDYEQAASLRDEIREMEKEVHAQ